MPEEGLVITGDDSSVGVTAPKDLVAWQAVEVEDGDVDAPDLV